MTKTVKRSLIAAVGLAALLLLVVQPGLQMPTASVEPVSPSLAVHDGPERATGAQGHPELFLEVHHAIRANEEGVNDYPMGFQVLEFNKARAALKSASTTLNWVERGPGNVGGRTRPILIDPDDPDLHTWFVGTAGGGVWWTQNRGYAWGYLFDDQPALAVSALAMAESNHDVLYAGTGEGFGNVDASRGAGIFKSYDRGQSWDHLLSTATDTAFAYVNRLAVHPTDENVVVAATNSGIYRTTDGGLFWTESWSANGARVQDLQAQPGNFNTMIAGANPGGILRSIDGGQTWTFAIGSSEILGGSQRIELAYSTYDPAIAYASVQRSGGASLVRSSDGGATWRNTRQSGLFTLNWLGGQGWYDNAIAVHPFAPDTVHVGGIFTWRLMMDGQLLDVAEPSGFQFFKPGQSVTVNYVSGLGNYFGVLLAGYEDAVFSDIEEADNGSVEIRYGQGTQYAHRFTSNDSTTSDVACFFLPYDRNEYQDYVEVPFTVWNIDTGQQLAVSFRDTAMDSTYNLINFLIAGSCNSVSNEQLFVHKYEYDASAPHDSVAQDGGVTTGMMYMVLPILAGGATWDPANLSPQTTTITYMRASGLLGYEFDGNLDPTVDTHVDHHAIVHIPIDEADNDFWVINSNDGGVAISTDAGLTFTETDQHFVGFNTSQFYGVAKRPGVVQYVGGTQDNGSWRSYGNANNRRGWTSVLGGDGFEAIWHQRDKDKIVVTSQFNFVFSTDNGGADWNLNFDLFFGDPGIFITSVSNSPLSPDTAYVMGAFGVWRTYDWFQTVSLTPMDSAWSTTYIGKVRAGSAADSIVWAGSGLDDAPRRTLWYSTDAGQTFTPTALPDIPRAPKTITSGLATHPTEAGTAYALFSRSKYPKILETKDYGATWADISGFSESTDGHSVRGFPNAAVFDLLVLPHAPNVMWAGTEIGLFQTKSYGKEWNYAHNGLPAVSVFRMKYQDDEIVVATHGRGIWTVPWSEIDVSVDDDDFGELPKTFTLEQNYPNPFNPTTTINFSVPEESLVRLTVFDALGRRVTVLTDQAYPPGAHELVWDASAYASGVYFYRMEAAGKLIQTQKMMLIK